MVSFTLAFSLHHLDVLIRSSISGDLGIPVVRTASIRRQPLRGSNNSINSPRIVRSHGRHHQRSSPMPNRAAKRRQDIEQSTASLNSVNSIEVWGGNQFNSFPQSSLIIEKELTFLMKKFSENSKRKKCDTKMILKRCACHLITIKFWWWVCLAIFLNWPEAEATQSKIMLRIEVNADSPGSRVRWKGFDCIIKEWREQNRTQIKNTFH